MGILNTDNEDDIQDTLDSKEENEETSVDGEITDSSNIDKDTPTVVLNGPLSEIMTKALNLALSNESTMATMVSAFKIEHDRRKNEAITDKDVYVYSTDSDNLESDGLVSAINEISEDSKGYSNVIITVESSKITKNNILFYNLCKNNKYDIFTNSGLAVNNILNNRFRS